MTPKQFLQEKWQGKHFIKENIYTNPKGQEERHKIVVEEEEKLKKVKKPAEQKIQLEEENSQV